MLCPATHHSPSAHTTARPCVHRCRKGHSLGSVAFGLHHCHCGHSTTAVPFGQYEPLGHASALPLTHERPGGHLTATPCTQACDSGHFLACVAFPGHHKLLGHRSFFVVVGQYDPTGHHCPPVRVFVGQYICARHRCFRVSSEQYHPAGHPRCVPLQYTSVNVQFVGTTVFSPQYVPCPHVRAVVEFAGQYVPTEQSRRSDGVGQYEPAGHCRVNADPSGHH